MICGAFWIFSSGRIVMKVIDCLQKETNSISLFAKSIAIKDLTSIELLAELMHVAIGISPTLTWRDGPEIGTSKLLHVAIEIWPALSWRGAPENGVSNPSVALSSASNSAVCKIPKNDNKYEWLKLTTNTWIFCDTHLIWTGSGRCCSLFQCKMFRNVSDAIFYIFIYLAQTLMKFGAFLCFDALLKHNSNQFLFFRCHCSFFHTFKFFPSGRTTFENIDVFVQKSQ